jgi:hypothetical protein
MLMLKAERERCNFTVSERGIKIKSKGKSKATPHQDVAAKMRRDIIKRRELRE